MTFPQNDGLDQTMTIYAWLGVDDTGHEGICMVPVSTEDFGTQGVALISNHRERAMQLSSLAWQVAVARKETVRLVAFSRAEIVDEITPLSADI